MPDSLVCVICSLACSSLSNTRAHIIAAHPDSPSPGSQVQRTLIPHPRREGFSILPGALEQLPSFRALNLG